MTGPELEKKISMPRPPGTVDFHFRDPGLGVEIEVWVKPEDRSRLKEEVVAV